MVPILETSKCGIIESRSSPATASARKSFPPASKSRGAGVAEGGFELEVDRFDWGRIITRRRLMMPADGRDQIKEPRCHLFGAVGHPDMPDHITLWGLRLAICQPFDQYANVRPTRVLPGITSPAAPREPARSSIG